MIKNLAILLAIALLLNCSEDQEVNEPTEIPELAGTWKLVAQYLDPGDGSCDFVPVKSSKTIEFLKDETYMANGSLCDIDPDTGSVTTCTYVIGEELTDFSLVPFVS